MDTSFEQDRLVGSARRADDLHLVHRLRRLRRTPGLRALVQEARVTTDDLMLPLFVVDGSGKSEPVESMPGVFRESVDRMIKRARSANKIGIRAVILFGIPDLKDAVGSGSHDSKGVVQRAVTALKEEIPDLVVVTDTCMCEYTDHGHCGLLDDRMDVDNDATLAALAKIAVSQAESGADLVAPSGMFFNARYSKFHMGNFTDERFIDIFKSDRYWKIMDYLASPNFDAQTMMGTLPIQYYVSEALDKHIKGIEKITPNSGPKPLHVNFL